MDVQERRELIYYGKTLIEEGLAFGSGGNLSVRLDGSEKFMITPSGMDYFAIKERDLVAMDTYGNVVEGFRTPSSEWQMHAEIYDRRSDIHALIHTHSKYISVLSTLGEDLQAISYLIASSGTSRIPLAPYETFGTPALARSAAEHLGDRSKAVILANHGLIAGGKTLKEALEITKDLEFCAFLYITALSTGKEISFISDEKIDEVIARAKDYGQKSESNKKRR
ncbi:L-fuculose phosphate aldolase [Aedoeadaptatus ivorii]|uniref:L-fuculose phosphate aldolase n=1 Tax=Aedoeadaptatus ivorii TaxID=54006 RepID=A0A3S4YVP4_9FIRM|nr:class II aldolase/adducin family protein [Peptoniphilus ivorii]MDQ0508141.1 L-fuculose-phosphate aldolase [Peptoniphilus ivorii]VEJ35872.1 L-fuculose phosphate aldolase [Peptoniphilus ivorii]